MKKSKRTGEDTLYTMSPLKWFLKAGSPLFIFLFILIVLIVYVVPFLSGPDMEYIKGLWMLFVLLVICAALLSYSYALKGLIRLKRQEWTVRKRYKDRLENGLEQTKRDWFVRTSGARLIIYHRDYIEAIERETQEDWENKSSSTTLYLTYIRTCQGKREKITFIFHDDAADFREWFLASQK